MPDQIGTWKYVASFSDGQPAGSGEFVVSAGDIPGMISADESNPRWFGFKGGNHFLMRSFHIGDRFFADNANGTNWSSAKRTAFLDWAQEQGYNTLSIASHLLKRDADGRGQGWDTPNLWDDGSNKPRAAEYQKMEAILNELSNRKIIVYQFAGIYGKESNFPPKGDRAAQELYQKYTMARLLPYWNILWNFAGPEPRISGSDGGSAYQNSMSDGDLDNFYSKWKEEIDPFGVLISVQNQRKSNFPQDPFRDKSWETYMTLQGPKTTSHKEVYDRIRQIVGNRVKPVYSQETVWQGNQNHPSYTASQIRKNSYTAIMAGSSLNFADMSGNSSSGFSGTMDLNDINDKVSYDGHAIVHNVWDAIETTAWWKLDPKPDLVDKGYCLAKEGEEYLVYLPDGGTVNVSLTGGPYKLRWTKGDDATTTQEDENISSGDNLQTPWSGDALLHLYIQSATNVMNPKHPEASLVKTWVHQGNLHVELPFAMSEKAAPEVHIKKIDGTLAAVLTPGKKSTTGFQYTWESAGKPIKRGVYVVTINGISVIAKPIAVMAP